MLAFLCGEFRLWLSAGCVLVTILVFHCVLFHSNAFSVVAGPAQKRRAIPWHHRVWSGQHQGPHSTSTLFHTLQAIIASETAAFTVARTPAGAATVVLTDDVPPAACRCNKQLNATWELCGATVASGQACGCVDVPCTAALALTPATPDIACPADEAAAPPISLPTSTTIQIQLQCGLSRVTRPTAMHSPRHIDSECMPGAPGHRADCFARCYASGR